MGSRELLETKGLLASIIDSSDDAIISKSLDGVITSWNRAAEAMFGYKAADAIGERISLIIPPDRFKEEEEVIARIRRGQKVDHFQTVRQTKDGRMIDVSLTVSPIKNAEGVVIGASKVARDITQLKRGEMERDKLLNLEQTIRRAAEEANRLKDEFLAVLSHELRSPLNAIVGWTTLLRNGGLDTVKTSHALETISRNAQQQDLLVSDLLDISRVIKGKHRLNVKPVSLPDVLKVAIEVTRPAIDAKKISLEVTIDSDVGSITGDPDRLQQIFWNLLSNAAKFTPEGGRVEVHAQRIVSHVEVVVSDTGVGIRPKVLPYVFDRFRQGDTGFAREHGGLGLGLAIVRSLVELHGGNIRADSAAQIGAPVSP